MGEIDSNFEFAPLRDLDDFLLKSARFDIPPVKNLDKWGNRVANNIYYYQTNYLVLAISVLFILGIVHPFDMAPSFFVIAVGYFSFSFHPSFQLFTLIFTAYSYQNILQSTVLIIWGLFVSAILILLHASLRLRNIKNKLANNSNGYEFKKLRMKINKFFEDKYKNELNK